MTTYKQRPTLKCEAMQWHAHQTPQHPSTADCARRIIRWIKDNGGESHTVGIGSDGSLSEEPEIAVRSIGGWVFLRPGDYARKGDDPLEDGDRMIVPFFRHHPDEFTERWEPDA